MAAAAERAEAQVASPAVPAVSTTLISARSVRPRMPGAGWVVSTVQNAPLMATRA